MPSDGPLEVNEQIKFAILFIRSEIRTRLQEVTTIFDLVPSSLLYHEDLSSFNYWIPMSPSNTLFADRSNIVFTFFCIFLYILQNVRKPRVNWALDSIWSSISFRGLGRVKDPEPRKTSAPAEIIRIGGPRPVNRGFTGIRY